MDNKRQVALQHNQDKRSVVTLNSATQLPKAGAFLWNKKMMIQMNCRGYAVSQFMQPEPAKYAHGPALEAKTFMQPEHHYYTNHPGRFFYIKDEDTGEFFSAPYEPVRAIECDFQFIVEQHQLAWQVTHLDIEVKLTLTLGVEDPLEIWQCQVTNLSNRVRNISIYPYFTIGYMSWMNQSANYNVNLNGIVASSITPYQKVEQYFENQLLKDKTYFLADKAPTAWLANQLAFEGEGGLHNPDAIKLKQLSKQNACYEVPAAVFQFSQTLSPKQAQTFNFLFGPAKDEQEIADIKTKYFANSETLEKQKQAYQQYIEAIKPSLELNTDNRFFDDMINQWIPRQMFYHGDVNRLTTDPQTRNYVQDNMGMNYLDSNITRASILTALSQQHASGEMPDGILLHPDAELKYINQVPHADHCVWLPVCLTVYLDETNDGSILQEKLPFADSQTLATVVEHIELSLDCLIAARDERGLSFIEQGDWCDPMNMVGYQGKGVSSWLSMATVYAINCWLDICHHYVIDINLEKIEHYRKVANQMVDAIHRYFWDGQWFARGRTDQDVAFGISDDKEGRIYLNAQSWALLSNIVSVEQRKAILSQVKQQLITPYGPMMLAPSYTQMREDVGRLTQKSPGVSENGSVYNHAAVFYIYALYQIGEAQTAFELLNAMLPNLDKTEAHGQLPVFISNYYRGAYYQFPDTAGRSSQLFNTGTVAWLYRCVVEGLCGLKGNRGELIVSPQLPKELDKISGVRKFQGACFDFDIVKSNVKAAKLTLDGKTLSCNIVTNIEAGKEYRLFIEVPK